MKKDKKKKISYCIEIDYDFYLKNKKREIKKIIKSDLDDMSLIEYLDLDNISKIKKFNKFVNKNLNKIIEYYWGISENYHDYSEGEIATELYKKYN